MYCCTAVFISRVYNYLRHSYRWGTKQDRVLHALSYIPLLNEIFCTNCMKSRVVRVRTWWYLRANISVEASSETYTHEKHGKCWRRCGKLFSILFSWEAGRVISRILYHGQMSCYYSFVRWKVKLLFVWELRRVLNDPMIIFELEVI